MRHFRDRTIVPFGKNVIEEDGHVVFEIVSHFSSGFVGSTDDVDGGFEAGGCRGATHEADDGFERVEQQALARSASMRKEACSIGLYFEQ